MMSFRRRPARQARAVVPAAAQSLESRTLLASTLAYDFTPGGSSQPHDFVTLGDAAYFVTHTAINAGLGPAILWKTDGTEAGTTIVKAFAPSPGASTAADPDHLSVVGDRLYFYAADGGGYLKPWVSDGTAAGTHQIKTAGGPPPSGTQGFVGTGGLAFFSDESGVWITDGTPAGTRPLPGIGQLLNEERNLAVSGGRFYLSAKTAAGGIGLFTADGTEGGTRLLRDFGNDGTPVLSRVIEMTDIDGTLYFAAPAAPGEGRELWKSDGTPEGTVLVKDILPGPGSSKTHWLTNVGGTLFFAATDNPASSGDSDALWRSDGTEAGTMKVLERAPGSDTPLRPRDIVNWNGEAVFAGTDTAHGQELWRSDGTAAGTSLAVDARPGPESGIGLQPKFALAGNQLFFESPPGAQGHELWVSDGTTEGTRWTGASVNSNGAESVGAAVDGRLVFENMGNAWISDGTTAGTHRLGVLLPTPASSQIKSFIPLGPDRILVNRNDRDVYAVDAANNAVLLMKNTYVANAPYGMPTSRARWASLGDVVVFAARPPENFGAVRVYRTDGTPQGTFELSTVNLDPRGTFLGHMGAPTLVPFDGKVYFAAADATRGAELWRTDGTKEGTVIVRDLAPGLPGSMPAVTNPDNRPSMAVVGDRLYFRAFTDQLWKTDGTAGGTELVKDLGAPGFFGSFHRVGDRLFFTGASGARSSALWTSDGTASGTVALPRPTSVAGAITSIGGVAYFVGSEAGGVTGAIFRSDGTPEGTYALTGSGPGGAPTETAVVGGTVYFARNGELWKTDGTAAGTMMLLPAVAAWDLHSLTAVGDTLYFSRRDAAHGQELWKSDGTPAGTVIAEDVWPGATSGKVEGLTNVGGTLYFAAADPLNGFELRRLDPPPHVAGRHVFYNNSAFDGGDAAASAADDGALAHGPLPLLPGRAASFANVSGYTRGINGIMIDVAGRLPPAALSAIAADLRLQTGAGGDPATWADAPRPSDVAVRKGAGVNGTDRITLVWPDGAIRNTWLRVTVRATPDTGLAADDVFTFGNLVGETGDAAAPAVGPRDALATRANQSPRRVTPGNRYDHNRDGRVNVLDYAAALRNSGAALRQPLPPVEPPSPAAGAGRAASRPARRSLLADGGAPPPLT